MKVTLGAGDCLQLFKSLQDESVDLIVTDPPFNVSQSKSFKNSDGSIGFKGWNPILENDWDAMTTEQFREFLREVLTQCCRVLKKNGSMYVFMGTGQLHYLGTVLEELGFYTLNLIAWHQPNKFPQNYGKTRYSPATEMVYFVRKGKKHYFHHTEFLRDMWQYNTVGGKERFHPAQKPVALLERMVEHSCPKGGVVLDPFLGSGSTGVAAIQNECDFIGFEKDPKWYDLAKDRLLGSGGILIDIELEEI